MTVQYWDIHFHYISDTWDNSYWIWDSPNALNQPFHLGMVDTQKAGDDLGMVNTIGFTQILAI